ncbi:B12-binding domain-containing radical SAM protein [Methylomonas sp. SURF-2]|uniref:B12-binding domain-containing radical SAM protein n=2 Tax=Methylomonas subterranea TaxID=2952225 RepID=A0ABT1TB76_9GAMM|nr:radical SAM protein [Methylomonas sp. SURF-2]MCQ8102496.1 B12-binding domain-containing radical SAM protein [Methylomonas sp. SURF-2]
MDLLLINPDSSAKAYQDLAKTYSAIEPPTFALLLAESCRSKGFGVTILDCIAECLTLDQSVKRVVDLAPRLVLFVVYGQNPNSGTTGMIGALALARAIKQDDCINCRIAFVGSHTSALPLEVLAHDCVDIVLLNEGVYALHNLLNGNLKRDLAHVKGIGYKQEGTSLPVINPPQSVVPQERMDEDLPGYAWDLLPYREKPLDLYRAHFWHAGFSHEKRTPFAAIYTSLGCNFGCDFCMINIVNRSDNSDGIDASHSRGMRFWSPAWVIREMEKLAKLGVRTLRISDEMFFLNRKYYEPILQNVVDQGFDFNMWTYSRVDTVRRDALDLFKRSGVNWLALGIETGNQMVRQEVSKGSFKEINIREVCNTIGEVGINIISNYIFGFPDDTLETMQQTLDLAIELNTEMANMYPCQALPGSPMYHIAKRNGWKLPETYEGFAFLSYACEPLPTRHLSSADVLRFRDRAWHTYFSNPAYLELAERRFGAQERKNIEDMASIRLKRKLLGD